MPPGEYQSIKDHPHNNKLCRKIKTDGIHNIKDLIKDIKENHFHLHVVKFLKMFKLKE